MALIKTVRSKSPIIGQNCYIAENAVIAGDVTVGNNCSIWFHSVIRGDVNPIRIGNNVNIQDGAIIHCTYEKTKTKVGNNVSIGHGAILHGCTVSDNVLIGMRAVIMDGAVIGDNCVIAAGSIVLENTTVESGSVYAGVPAKRIKEIEQDLIDGEIQRIARNYLLYASWYDPSIHINTE